MNKLTTLLFMVTFALAACPDGYYEDDCGNCWLPYCYNYITHGISYDISEDECIGTTMWVIPGDDGDPYFNSYCDSCPEGYYADDCGHCWMPYCYTLFADPPHTVYLDLTEDECSDAGYGWYTPGATGDPYYNSNCEGCPDGEVVDDCGVCQTGEDSAYWNMSCQDCAGVANGSALIDDCEVCQSAYCYDFVTHDVSFTLPCSGATIIEVSPDSASNPYWNSSCTDCAGIVDGTSMEDDCGVCQDAYCYDYVSHQTNTDFPCDGPTEMFVSPDSASNPYWNSSCNPNGCTLGDVTGDGSLNILDVVAIIDHILNADGSVLECGDINGDGIINILDVVSAVDSIVNGRMSDASYIDFIKHANGVSMQYDGFIGGIQMTIVHDNNFTLELSSESLVSKYKTNGNSTTMIVAVPENDNLFTSSGEFQIVDLIVANSKNEIDYDINDLTELVSHLGAAYPNPFNPTTSFELNVVDNGYVSVEIYNMMGQLVESLVNGNMDANIYTISWNASDVPSGMYIARFQSGMTISSQKLLLVK